MSDSGGPNAIVIVSAVHDYRMRRRGSIQAIADALARRGCSVRFVSVRFSPLSLIKSDPRAFLWARANRNETCGDIDCFLWRTPFHPFATGQAALDKALTPLHAAYAALPGRTLDRNLSGAAAVIVESGLGVVLLRRIRRLNPHARIIYLAADKLEAIGAHPHLQRTLEAAADIIDSVCLRSRGMAEEFRWAEGKVRFLPPGVHPPDFHNLGASPYEGGLNAVSVGSMLFDASFFEHASAAFPQVTFHVIGSGRALTPRHNLRVYPEMPFKQTLPYLAHATFGVAPYRGGADAGYIADSSLKLLQYGYLGMPAVCPHFAVGAATRRFGYTPGDGAEIAAAVTRALAAPPGPRFEGVLSWDEVVERLLRPHDFPDTAVS